MIDGTSSDYWTLGIAMANTVDVPFRGGCMCGAIRYECTEAPRRMVNCHCRDCQFGSGSGYSATLVMAAGAVRVTKGQAKRYEKTAESGNIATREFCEICGTPLFASSSGRPGYVGVKAASLDNPGWFEPEADVWVVSAQAWDCMDPGIPKFQKSRPQAQQQ